MIFVFGGHSLKLRGIFAGTLRRQLTVSMILLVIGTVSAVGITSLKIAQQVIKSHTARFGGKMLNQAAFRLGSVINNAEITVDSIILDRRLAPLLFHLSSTDRKIREHTRLELQDLLLQYKVSLLPGTELTLVDNAGNAVTTYHLPVVPKELIPATLSQKSKVWRLRYFPGDKAGNLKFSGRLLELTARIVSLPGRPQEGWIILHMDYRMMESIMANISLQENALNRFQSDVVVVGTQNQAIFPWVAQTKPVLSSLFRKPPEQLHNPVFVEEKVNGKNHLVIMARVPWTSWTMYIAAPTSRLYTGLEQINRSVLIIGLICSLFAVFFAILLSFLVVQPVNKLRKTMLSVEDGNFSVKALEGGPLEIQTLGRAFNRMLGEVDNLTKRLVAEESQRKTAVIKTLQAQIAPHFVFNTLSAIAGMTATCSPGEVAEALCSLKCLLYLSIGKSGDFVTLAEEFEHIHHYLYLMNIRYPGKFALQMQLPEELAHCRIIRLVLQPLAENCLQHGFRSGGGTVTISAIRDGEAVLVHVADNGAGMPPEQLSKVWNQEQSGSGVGIRNVDERLKLSFGPGYGLTLTSQPGVGTTVTLRIPYRNLI
jgi:two-component system sensor histidine kinase YesM